jgi:adenylate cyclase
MVDALTQRGAEVIAFDIHFGREKEQGPDQALVDAVARAGNVVLVELLTGKRRPIADLGGRHVGMLWEEETLPPFPRLAAAARGLASFPLPKSGAAVSQFWVFKDSIETGATLPAVTLQVRGREALPALLERARALAPDQFGSPTAGEVASADAQGLRDLMRRLRIGFTAGAAAIDGEARGPERSALEVALEALYRGDAHRYINFYGPPGTIPTVPFQAVLQGEDPNLAPEALDFRGKAVFVGYSDLYDPGQPDRFYTVFTNDDGVDLSGVEIAATTYANLLTDRSLTPIDPRLAVAALLVFGVLLGTLVYGLPGWVGVPIALALASAYGVGAQFLFDAHAILPPIAIPLLVQAPAALFLGLLGQYLIERRRGERISKAISNYLPEEIARDLAENRLDAEKLNKVVYGVCLATDMAGFSTIAERLPPGELATFLNDYFETLAAPLKRHRVHVTEFRADAIMCAWIDQQPSVEPRRQALLAALEAGEAIKDFKRRHDMPGARLRIGLEAGVVYVGHAGGGGRFVYSIVGDSANTASRVEGLNKHVGTQILATGEVVAGFENLVTRFLGGFQFVGKSDATSVYEVVARRESASDAQLQLCSDFEAAMEPYWAGDWSAAAERLQGLLGEFPGDGPAQFFLERCRRFMADPDQAGDPRVTRMDAK